MVDKTKIQIQIDAIAKKAIKQINQLQGSLNKATASAASVNASLKGVNKTAASASLTGFNKRLTTTGAAMGFVKKQVVALTVSLGTLLAAYAGFSIVRGAVTNLLDFESALTEITTILPDASKSSEELAGSLINVSNQFGKDATEQAKSFYQIISAGITDNVKANKVLIASNKLAIGGLTSTETAVNALTNIINVYKGAAGTASDISDVLFGTVRLGKTRVDELAASLSLVTPTAQAIGVSFREVAGAVATLTTKGLTTSAAVTQLNAVFTAVLKKQDTAKQLLGVNAKAFSLQALRVKGLTKFLKDLNVATGGSEEILTKLLGRVEGSKAIIAFASDNFKKLSSVIGELEDSAGASEEAFKKVTSTIGAQINILKTQVSNIILKISLSGADAIVSILEGINNSIAFLKDNAETVFKGLRIIIFTFGVIAFKKLAEVVIASLASMITSIKIFSAQSFIGLNKAQIAMIALTGSTKALRISMQTLKAVATFGLSIALGFLIEKIFSLVDSFGGIKGAFDALVVVAKRSIEQIKGAFASLGIVVLGFISKIPLIEKILPKDALINQMNSFAKSVINSSNKVNDLNRSLASLGGKNKDLLISAENIKPPSKMELTQNGEIKQTDIVKDFVISLTSGITSGIKSAGSFINSISLESIKNISITKDSVVGALKTIGSAIISFAKLVIDNAAEIGIGTASFAVKGKAGASQLLSQVGGGVAETFLPGAGGAVAGIIGELAKGPEHVKSMIKEFVKAIPDMVMAIAEALPVLLEELLIGLSEIIVKIAEKADVIVLAIVKGLLKALPRIAISLAKAMPMVAMELVKAMPEVAIGLVKALVEEAPKFIEALIDGLTGGLTGGLLGGDGGGKGSSTTSKVLNVATGGLSGMFGFAKGGEIKQVLGGVAGKDSVPAALMKGEVVVDKTTTSQLKDFLKSQQRPDQSNSDALLLKILDALNSKQEVRTEVVFRDKTLADIMIQMNRTGARLA